MHVISIQHVYVWLQSRMPHSIPVRFQRTQILNAPILAVARLAGSRPFQLGEDTLSLDPVIDTSAPATIHLPIGQYIRSETVFRLLQGVRQKHRKYACARRPGVSLRPACLLPLQAGCGAHAAYAPRLRLYQAFSRMHWSQNSKR
jgi:hypothetical protein